MNKLFFTWYSGSPISRNCTLPMIQPSSRLSVVWGFCSDHMVLWLSSPLFFTRTSKKLISPSFWNGIYIRIQIRLSSTVYCKLDYYEKSDGNTLTSNQKFKHSSWCSFPINPGEVSHVTECWSLETSESLYPAITNALSPFL